MRNGLLLMILILLLIMAVGAFILYIYLKRKVSSFSRAMFGTDSLVKGLKQQDEQLAATPKSVSGMTRIFLPQIMEDFPEFSLPEFIHRSENQLKGALNAVDIQSLEPLSGAAGDLKEQIRIRIEHNKQSGIRERFQNIRIHQTEVSDYQKLGGSCVITLQSAVEYYYGREVEGRTGEAPKRTQTKYNLELMYIQDAALISGRTTGQSTVCPQCGAPVNRLGNKKCEYCGSYVEPINIRSWSLTKISEV